MAEAAENPATKEEPGIESEDVESRIKDAMRARVQHFKEQADSLTFEAVRRMIEQDLGFEKFKLDVHKRFIKQFLVQCLEGEVVDIASKGSGETVENHVCATKEEAAGSPIELASEKDVKEHGSGDEGKMEDSPVMGLLTAKKATKKTGETPAKKEKEAPSESTIKKAMWKRASYIKANADKVTMAELRWLLEEDLELDKYVLDPYKKLIREQLDEVLKSFEVSKPKEKKKSSRAKSSKNVSDEESMDSLVAESEEDEEEVKPKKKAALKQKIEGSRKRKRTENNVETSRKKGTKPVKTVAKNNRGEDEDEDHSHSIAEKPVQKKEASTPTYGKHVEHLKSVIKSCGMSVPPVIYKKVKQVPENKREAQLIKELEDILSREGLSSNPSEKEIKEVRKRKERARELEGIDMSNIVSSSRRRSTSRYVAPPKPEVPVESDNDDDESDEAEDDDDDDDDDKNGEENEGDDGDNDGDNDGDDDSESEELDKEDDEDSD